MWTAKIGEVVKDKNKVTVTITFFLNGEYSFNENIGISQFTTLDDINRQSQNRINELNASYAFADTLIEGQDLLPIVLSKEEQDKIDFSNKLSQLYQLKSYLDLGLITQTDQTYTTLQTDLQSQIQTKVSEINNIIN